jgi:hypothetical protein
MSVAEHSLISLDYSAIDPGMEIITEDATILGRTISIKHDRPNDSIDIFFVDTVHPMLALFSSIYRISILEICTVIYHLR